MPVITVSDARAEFSGLVARFRDDPGAEPVVIGAHRRPEVVMLSAQAYRVLTEGARPSVSLDVLRRLAPVIERLAAASRLANVRVFGSVARGDQAPGSDVDLLVDVGEGATLFDVAQFELDMEALLGVPVSAVAAASLDAARDGRILTEAVAL